MKIIYYTAVSLDGYIATSDGGVEWLQSIEVPGEDYGYEAFYASVDGLIMGGNTFRQIQGWGEYPYPGKPAWVLTRQPVENAPSEVTSGPFSPEDVVAQAKAQELAFLWLVGGGKLAQSFRRAGLLTDYYLTIVPILLGDGIRLLEPGDGTNSLDLRNTQTYPSGVVQLQYRVR
ncbi:MAG: dihydrofolate reductase family protein [Armatimonadaceae bacterium]